MIPRLRKKCIPIIKQIAEEYQSLSEVEGSGLEVCGGEKGHAKRRDGPQDTTARGD